jgi:hypothetical protein
VGGGTLDRLLKSGEELRREGVIPVRGKPILEWEEVVLDRALKTLKERRDEKMAAALKKANRLN